MRRSILPQEAKSALVDEVDPIYSKSDPIEASIEIRKKAGDVRSHVPDKNSKQGKFFFKIHLKDGPNKISEKV